MHHYSNYLNGQFVECDAERITVSCPSTGKELSTIPNSPASVVDEAIAAAEQAQPAWAALPAIARAKHLNQLANKLRENLEPLARCITEEQGKTLGLARVEVNFTADYIDYMAEWGRRIEGEIIPSDRPRRTNLPPPQANRRRWRHPPLELPFFLIARKLAPALICGNTIVIKPSEETPNNAFEFCKLLDQTDIPAGVVNMVSGLGGSTGSALCASPKLGLLSFTGSVDTGSRIMAAAAKNITRVNLELGGKAPAIVTAQADLDVAATAIQASRVINSGQVCNCAERVYVQRKVADEFTDKLVAKMQAAKYGNPNTDENGRLRPNDQRSRLQQSRRPGRECQASRC